METIKKVDLYLSSNDFRGFANSLIIPTVLGFAFQTAIVPIIWLCFCVAIYKFTKKKNTERAEIFFEYLKTASSLYLVMFVAYLFLLIE